MNMGEVDSRLQIWLERFLNNLQARFIPCISMDPGTLGTSAGRDMKLALALIPKCNDTQIKKRRTQDLASRS